MCYLNSIGGGGGGGGGGGLNFCSATSNWLTKSMSKINIKRECNYLTNESNSKSDIKL